ncbi:MAG: hypothetical protein GY787_20325 [Alteromonadales bacterium]|nr:hypothetical protein [Alteromonadales bacterium]
MSTGWVKLHRKITEWEWYSDVNTTRVFLHLLVVANHKDKKWRGIDIKRGQRLTSISALSKETNLTIKNIRTAIKRLKSTNEVASYSTAQHTVFTMVNYDLYQEEANETANQGQTEGKQGATNKNVKNEKNVNEDIYQQIADAYNEVFPHLPQVVKVSQKRKSHISASINEFKKDFGFDNPDNWKSLFYHAAKSDFLNGRKTDWSMDFDFVINKTNLLKIIEGNYDNV